MSLIISIEVLHYIHCHALAAFFTYLPDLLFAESNFGPIIALVRQVFRWPGIRRVS